MIIYLLTLIRAIFLLPYMALHTLFFSIVTIIFGGLRIQRIADWGVHLWGAGLVWISGVKIVVKGRENVPTSRGVLFLFNHQSFYDIFVIHALFKHTVRFGAKIELFRIPIFGSAMRAAGALPIARDNRAQVMEVYRNAQKKFAEGWNYVLAPEGTRQSQAAIGRFKKGPFIFAINAQVPIVPIVIKGAIEVMEKNSVFINLGKWQRTVYVEFLPVVETQGQSLENMEPLIEGVREQMVQSFARLGSA